MMRLCTLANGSAALVAAAIGAACLPAAAFTVEDWLAHAVPAAEPDLDYDGAPVTMTFSSPNPEASLVPEVWGRGFDWLTEATDGGLVVEAFHGGTLHGAQDGWRAVRNQVTDWATCYTSYEASGFPLHKMFEMPFVTPSDPTVATRVAQLLAPEYFVPEWEGRGVLYGYTVIAGVSDIMSTEPVRTPDDLEGLRVIAQGFPPEAAEALGMVTLNIPFPEIYSALQQGLADAVIWVDPGFVPFRIYELAKYHTSLGLTAQHIDTCINPDSYAGLPEPLKPVFAAFQQRIAHAVSQRIGVEFREQARAIYEENGVEMITLDDAERQAWRDALAPVVDARVAELVEQGIPADELLADIRRLEEEYTGATPEEVFERTVEEPAAILPQ